MSILSYPNRGPWGDSKWRGNCSGYIYKELFERLKPQFFVDPMVGSGTSIEVAKELGIEAIGLDLHSGFNCLKDSILERIQKPADLIISHPPYGEMIKYSGSVWGDQAHQDDLSHCLNDEDFHQKLQQVLLNQRQATLPGAYYGTIIGDLRSKGRYVSYQAEAIARMPSEELAAVLIKQQHNVSSSSKNYGSMKMPFIFHEYVLLWQKKQESIFYFLNTVAKQAQQRLTGTWLNIVKIALCSLGQPASLEMIYQSISHCPKVQANTNWKAKVRQILNQNPLYFSSEQRGVWRLN